MTSQTRLPNLKELVHGRNGLLKIVEFALEEIGEVQQDIRMRCLHARLASVSYPCLFWSEDLALGDQIELLLNRSSHRRKIKVGINLPIAVDLNRRQ